MKNEFAHAEVTCGHDSFQPIGALLGGILKEGRRREELRPRLEAKLGRPLTDEEFLKFADSTGLRI